ncbi:PE-PGRS family protein [Methylobacterium nodulans ORS 2060]|uniref:PE-PGRS family protein n=1 Tax=Methylobacterium nodulans (strain LMG 21967 / CNCM I-2342 / ORS 2060) TaxID=460265 RepID=B8ITR0_METNO|nr:PE-PGRS family protein [Methylobacterium nodulans ORS 2060]
MQEVDRDTQHNERATDDACRRAVTRNQKKGSARAVSDARDLDGAGAHAAERGTSELRPQKAPLSAQGEGASPGGNAHDGQCSSRERQRRPGPRSAGRAAGANRIADLSDAKRVAPGPARTGAGHCRTGRAAGWARLAGPAGLGGGRAAGWARLAGPAGLGGGRGAHDASRLAATGRVKTPGWSGAGATAESVAGLLEHGSVAVGAEAADEAQAGRAAPCRRGDVTRPLTEPAFQRQVLFGREQHRRGWAGFGDGEQGSVADPRDPQRTNHLRSGPDHAAAPLRRA